MSTDPSTLHHCYARDVTILKAYIEYVVCNKSERPSQDILEALAYSQGKALFFWQLNDCYQLIRCSGRMYHHEPTNTSIDLLKIKEHYFDRLVWSLRCK